MVVASRCGSRCCCHPGVQKKGRSFASRARWCVHSRRNSRWSCGRRDPRLGAYHYFASCCAGGCSRPDYVSVDVRCPFGYLPAHQGGGDQPKMARGHHSFPRRRRTDACGCRQSMCFGSGVGGRSCCSGERPVPHRPRGRRSTSSRPAWGLKPSFGCRAYTAAQPGFSGKWASSRYGRNESSGFFVIQCAAKASRGLGNGGPERRPAPGPKPHQELWLARKMCWLQRSWRRKLGTFPTKAPTSTR